MKDQDEKAVGFEEATYKLLRALNVVCTFEHPGWINVPALEAGHHWEIGTANENWGADYTTDAGCNVFSIELPIPSDSASIPMIGEAIAKLVREPAELHQLRAEKSELLPLLGRALAVIQYGDNDADEHAELIGQIRASIINAGGTL